MHMHFNEHAQPGSQVSTRLKCAVVLMLAFVTLELGAGLLSHSLSVFSDAAQNFVDALALLLVWWSQNLSKRPPDRLRTFGYHRANILVALLNAVIVIPVVIDIAYRAIDRFFHPMAVDASVMGAVGLIGMVCNITVVLLLRSNSNKLNIRGAYLHNLADALGSVFLLISGVIIYYTGAVWVDLILALSICVLITWTMIPVARKAVHILLEGTPDGVDPETVTAAILEFPDVVQVHDLHAWTHGDGMSALTCHIGLKATVPHDQDHDLVDSIRAMLRQRFQVSHTTIQVEHHTCEQNVKCIWNGGTDEQ